MSIITRESIIIGYVTFLSFISILITFGGLGNFLTFGTAIVSPTFPTFTEGNFIVNLFGFITFPFSLLVYFFTLMTYGFAAGNIGLLILGSLIVLPASVAFLYIVITIIRGN